MYLKQSTAVTVKIGPFVDDTDGKTAETALTISQADIRLSKNGGAFAQSNNAAGATHDASGWYGVPLDTTDTNTLGKLELFVQESGALPVWRTFVVLHANVYDWLFGSTAPSTYAGGAVASVTGAVGSVTGNVGGNVTGSVGSVVATVAANLTQILGTALTETAGLIAAGFKKFFNVASPTGTVNSLPDAVAGAASGLALVGSNVGAATSVTGAVGSVTGNVGGNVVGNVNGNVNGNVSGSVGSVTGAVGSVTGAVGSVTGNVGGNVVGSTASVTGAVGSVAGDVGGNVSGKVLGGGGGTISGDGVRAESVTGAVGSVTGAVGSVTGAVGSVTGNVGGNVAGSVASVAAGGITASSIATDAIDADALSPDALTEIFTKIVTTAITESYRGANAEGTLAQLVYEINQSLSEFVISGTTKTVKKLDGSTTAKTYTLNSATTPTGITETT